MQKSVKGEETKDFRTQFNNLSTKNKIAYAILMLVLAAFVIYMTTVFTSSAIEYAIIFNQ